MAYEAENQAVSRDMLDEKDCLSGNISPSSEEGIMASNSQVRIPNTYGICRLILEVDGNKFVPLLIFS